MQTNTQAEQSRAQNRLELSDLEVLVDGINDLPEASYNVAVATYGIAGSYPPFAPGYHYYDAFYPLYNNDKVTLYDFEKSTSPVGYSRSENTKLVHQDQRSKNEKAIAESQKTLQTKEHRQRSNLQ